MKKYLPLVFIVLFFTTVYEEAVGQQSLADSLKGVLRKRKEIDTIRFELLVNIAKASRFDLPDTAVAYSEKAMQLARELEDRRRQIQALSLSGTAYYYKGMHERAEQIQQDAVELCYRYNILSELANVLSSLALAMQSRGKYDEAIETYFQALRTEERSGRKKEVAKIRANLSILYKDLGAYENSIKNARTAHLIIIKEFPDWSVALASVANTLGLAHLEMHRYDSALMYLFESYRVNRKANNITYGANSASNIAYCYLKLYEANKTAKYNLDSASKYIEIAFKSASQISNQVVLSVMYVNLGSVRLEQGKLDEALKYALKGGELAKHTNARARMLEVYKTLSEVYLKRKDFQQAYEYSHRAYLLNDSLKNYEAQRAAANVQRDYELLKKQDNIDQLAKEAELREAQLKSGQKVRYYLSISVLLLVMTVVLAYYGFRVKVRSNRRLQAKSKEIAHKNELLESVNRSLQDQALRTQMKPHFIFNALNSIQYLILQKENEKAYEYLSKFSQLLRSALEFSDQNFIELEKELKWLDLYVKLESLRFNYEFDFAIDFKNSQDELRDLKLPPFLVQPFVENAIAHGLMPKSGDRMLRILVERSNGALMVKVSDNGIGREKSAERKQGKEKRKSFGVDLVKKRLEILKNVSGKDYQCRIEDGKDDHGNAQGTLVTLTLPI